MVISQSFQFEDVLGFKFGYYLLGKPKMFTHVYFIDGLLIDTGQSNMAKSIMAATKSLPIEQIFITHHHEDHTGNIEQLQQQHACRVYASALCCKLMQKPPKLSLIQKLTWGNRPPALALIPTQNTIQTAKHTFQLIPIPGHAPDMVALYEPDQRWLFSADLFISTYIGYFLKEESVAEQIASTKKVLQLDFKILLCSHNPQLKNGKERLKKKLHFLESFFHDVKALHQQGCSVQEIFKRLPVKENIPVRLLSGGALSKMNMVKSVIRDVERG